MPTATPSPRDPDASWRRGTNPFATANVGPCGLTYRFVASGIHIDALAQQFSNRPTTVKRRGAASAWLIVGPHGSGKSTLIAQLQSKLQHEYPSTRLKTFHNGQACRGFTRWLMAQPQESLLIVDGIEQLDCARRFLLLLACRLGRLHCLATSHSQLRGFRILHRTTVNLDLAKQLASELLAAQPQRIPDALDYLEQIWDDHHGNLRDLWFAMYDWYQIQSAITL